MGGRPSRPLEQVLDELEQGLVGPLHVLEDEHRRVPVGHALEEQPPRREEVLPLAGLVLAEPEQLREPRLEPVALLGIEHPAPRARRAASPCADAASSASPIRQRIRTISASAQYATPSP